MSGKIWTANLGDKIWAACTNKNKFRTFNIFWQKNCSSWEWIKQQNYFFNVGPPKEDSFLDTFYVLYFNHHTCYHYKFSLWTFWKQENNYIAFFMAPHLIVNNFNSISNILFGPHIFTMVKSKQRPTILTLSHSTLAHALHVNDCWAVKSKLRQVWVMVMVKSNNGHFVTLYTFTLLVWDYNFFPTLWISWHSLPVHYQCSIIITLDCPGTTISHA